MTLQARIAQIQLKSSSEKLFQGKCENITLDTKNFPQIYSAQGELESEYAFVEWISIQLSIQHPECWYKVTGAEVRLRNGGFLIDSYGDNMNALMTLYPEYPWKPWLHCQVKRNFWKFVDNQRLFLAWLGEKLGIHKLHNWYNVSLEDINEHGKSFLHFHKGSMYCALEFIYPECKWHPWLFKDHRIAPFPRKMCEDYLQWTAEHAQMKCPEDWYNEKKDIGTLHNTLPNGLLALQKIYPEYEWQPWRLGPVGPNYWDNMHNVAKYVHWLEDELNITHPPQWNQMSKDIQVNTSLLTKYEGNFRMVLQSVYPNFIDCHLLEGHNIRRYLNSLGAKLGITSHEQWYHVTLEDITKRNANAVLQLYNDSLYTMLKHAYPEYVWYPWKFCEVVWEDIPLPEYLQWLAEQLKIETPEQWYSVQGDQLRQYYGSTPLKLYGSISNLLLSFSDYNWFPWRFERVHKGFWFQLDKHIQYVEWLVFQFQITKPEDWYSVQVRDISSIGGDRFLRMYDTSLCNILSSLYPEYNWLAWRFRKVTSGFWETSENLDSFVAWLSSQLDVFMPDDLAYVTAGEIESLKGGPALRMCGGLFSLLQKCFPEYTLDPQVVSKGHRNLLKALQSLFVHVDVYFNATVLQTAFSKSKFPMVLDIYVPVLRLAFEYQGQQHFYFHYQSGSPDELRRRDKEKKRMCYMENITLIDVPFWYKLTQNYVRTVIVKCRPDLLSACAH